MKTNNLADTEKPDDMHTGIGNRLMADEMGRRSASCHARGFAPLALSAGYLIKEMLKVLDSQSDDSALKL